MTPHQRDHFRRLLIDRALELYRGVRSDINEAVVMQAIAPDPVDEAEAAAVDEVRALRQELGERESLLLHEIEDALGRMRDGSYGRCIDCGRDIELGRLEIIPWAQRTAEHQARYEAESGRPRPPGL